MDLGEPENAMFCLMFWGDLKSALRLLRDCPGSWGRRLGYRGEGEGEGGGLAR